MSLLITRNSSLGFTDSSGSFSNSFLVAFDDFSSVLSSFTTSFERVFSLTLEFPTPGAGGFRGETEFELAFPSPVPLSGLLLCILCTIIETTSVPAS
ncbi:unnamed protein product [Brugia timori]|uniref:Uncharacterized protein n=1 Tax=Brugia timori TaxID=42155 RepID=A0A3P7TVP3_9BILA|nr:unnamed protein product [Brugia timori]